MPCLAWAACTFNLSPSFQTQSPPETKSDLTHWKSGNVTEVRRYCSVTIVAIVRLVYLIKTIANSASLTTNIANILIWTGVEINTSIICGQYKASFPAVLNTSSSVVLESLFVAIQFGHRKKRKKLDEGHSNTSSVPSLSPSHNQFHLRQAEATAQTYEHA